MSVGTWIRPQFAAAAAYRRTVRLLGGGASGGGDQVGVLTHHSHRRRSGWATHDGDAVACQRGDECVELTSPSST